MNLQAHISGQISGQVPNQSGTSLPGLSQQNGNPLSTQMQNPSVHRNIPNMDTETYKARKFITEKIYGFLMQRQQAQEIPSKRVLDIVKRLEEALFKSASSKEEYMNLGTLESRLHILIKRLPNNQNPQFSHVNSSSSIGTMIPTPGMPQSGNSTLIGSSSVDNSIMAGNPGSTITTTSSINSGNFLPTANGPSGGIHGGSFSSTDGSLGNGYQQMPSSFSISSGGNNLVASMGAQRMTSQMIPTPGFNNNTNSSDNLNNSSSNQPYMNLDSSNNVGALSSVDSTVVSQSLQQKQHVVSQNSRILQALGSHMSGGIRPGLQSRSYGTSTGSLNGGLGMIGNNMQLLNGQGASEGYMSTTMYANPSKHLPQHFDQHQRSVMQGDRYAISNADTTGSGNLFIPVSSVGSVMNNQNLSAVALQSIPKTNSTHMANQSNVNVSQQMTNMKLDQSEKMKFQSQHSLADNHLQSHPLQQFHPQSQQFQQQQQQQFAHNHHQQKSQQQQLLLKSNGYGQAPIMSDLGTKIKSEPGNHDEALLSQVPEQFQFSEMQNLYQPNSTGEHSKSNQLLPQSSQQDTFSSLTPSSEQMQQLLHHHMYAAETQTDFNNCSNGVHSDAMLQGQWYPKFQDGSQMPGSFSQEQNVQQESHQRTVRTEEAQRNNLPPEGTFAGQAVVNRVVNPNSSSSAVRKSSNLTRDGQFRNQQRWLLFLIHARRCSSPAGKCPEQHCILAQNLLKHLESCNALPCQYLRCSATKQVINHFRRCREANCPVCGPVRNFRLAQRKSFPRPDFSSEMPISVNGSCKAYDSGETALRLTAKSSLAVVETPEDLQPSLKRMKIEQSSQAFVSETESFVSPVSVGESHIFQETQVVEQHADTIVMKPEVMEVKMEIPANAGQGSPRSTDLLKDNLDETYIQRPAIDPLTSNITAPFPKQESIKAEKDVDPAKHENTSLPTESATGSKSGKPKIKGVSLTELFTPEQVQAHIIGLRQWVGQSKAKVEKNQAMEHSMSENSCQLCAVEKLTFEPPPIYCSPCGARIKRNAMYYTIGAGDTRHYFCIPCYNEARGDSIVVDGTNIPKARLEKKKNDEETEEWWVQCDKCEAWQHQICALFNGRRNDGGQAEYTCPNCYILEVERGERKPLPQSAVLGAKDLPRTILSDHIEQRLAKRLRQERQERARREGKSHDEVAGAEGLVVRVVSSVDKKLEVKPRFLEIFQEENYPSEFPYKSKVLLLFQRIEGVEVCLFGMYVQEFGSECAQPNHRRVYLSYLDSVKYFRPEIKAVTGEALRTFVYHEILIGYLEYCKKRGFTSCYIWACPPLKGEDYILYCHPEIQKTPKSDKLREWYLAMLRKAAKENIVVDLTNLYDHFFVSTGECKAKVTAARLPYFDGDYWPGAAEDMIYQLQQEEDGRKQHKKGTLKKTITKRALKASGQTDLSGNASKDLLLMHKLGETISPMKEDFIMVHLQHACSHCCILMVSETRWVCNQCKNFQLCDKCYEAEQKLEDRERHPINQKDKHMLYPVEINQVPADTRDEDEILESEFFDTRQAFLSLCQGNHYQYDTLRRAKHSSMMVLYHLHNPTAPAFVTTCNICHLDIEAGQGWRCEVCPEYDVCNACYQKDGGVDHPHKLTNHPSMADRDAQNKEARQQRVIQLRKMLELLVHASRCRSPQCQYPNCRKVKGLFRHGIQCKRRASGGCLLCKKMWYLLQLHARACKESECHVPRCRDLKEHLRRLQQQAESRRRAAVMEMMRQNAAEAAGNSA
nr:histone acetyltransferase HAC1-like isoform X1 [Ipomoea batatas]